MKNQRINSKIQWCEPDNNRRRATATMKEDGVLCFGTEMREKLPRKIRIGFLSSECALLVEENPEQGFMLSKNGEVSLSSVANQLLRLGIKLPVCFLFFEEAIENSWVGYIVPALRRTGKAEYSEERTSIFNAYKWLIDKAVYKYAKTTTSDERRAIANMALWEAISEYIQMHGPLKNYLSEEIRIALIKQNRQYVKFNQYNHASLDAPVNKNNQSSATIYELLPPRYKNEMLAVENRIHMELFRETHLDKRERGILKMLLDGYTVDEILPEHKMTEQELGKCCKSIGKRWELHLGDCI
ncbi:MAG: hypothetical protein FWG94_04085 [Oscillospiraceae bacterium]|nr:hypothetical protein [Oscillospiraceae bacterium]